MGGGNPYYKPRGRHFSSFHDFHERSSEYNTVGKGAEEEAGQHNIWARDTSKNDDHIFIPEPIIEEPESVVSTPESRALFLGEYYSCLIGGIPPPSTTDESWPTMLMKFQSMMLFRCSTWITLHRSRMLPRRRRVAAAPRKTTTTRTDISRLLMILLHSLVA